MTPDTGHFCFLLDRGPVPKGEAVPATGRAWHFGKGETSVSLPLPPGRHALTLQFSPRELVLRVQAVLRRGGPAAGTGVTSYGGQELVIDEPRRGATVRGAAAGQTPTEWGILVALATVPGRVYSRFELINRVRGYEFEGYERTIDSHDAVASSNRLVCGWRLRGLPIVARPCGDLLHIWSARSSSGLHRAGVSLRSGQPPCNTEAALSAPLTFGDG